MRIEITSTTDSQENVRAALGQPKANTEKESPEKGSDQPAPTPEKEPEQKEPAPSESAEEEVESETEAETGESESEPEGEGDEKSASAKDEKTRKQSGGWQRRIDKKTREAADARREADYWKAQALKGAAAEKPQSQEPAKQIAQAQTKEPQPGDFETHAEFVKALTKWSSDQALATYKREQEEMSAKEQSSKAERSFAERVKSFAEKNQDFHDVIADGREQNMFVSQVMHEAIMDSENGPAMFYELAKNPAESVRIAQLSPHRQLMELGKIESRLTASQSAPSKQEQPNKTTKAPKPVTPVGSKGASVEKDIYDPTLSQKEYEAARAKMRAAARAAG